MNRLTAFALVCCVLLAPPAVALDDKSVRAADQPVGIVELVHNFPDQMPTGVTVSKAGRLFVNFPRWGDPVDFTVGEIRDGKVVPFPDAAVNRHNPDNEKDCFVSVQSVVVDPKDRLWVLDTGSIKFGPTKFGGPKLVGIDLATNKIFKKILLPQDVALPTSYANDVRFDLEKGTGGIAYITDSSGGGPNGIIVVDLGTETSWRKLHDHPSTKAEKGMLPVVEGRPLMNRPAPGKSSFITIGSDGIALSADKKRLFYCPLISRRLYSVDADLLADRNAAPEKVASSVIDHGDKGGAADGMEADSSGNLFITNYEHNAITRRDAKGNLSTVVHAPTILWPDTLAISADGYLYFIANQLHRQALFHDGADQRVKPYALFRTKL